MTAERSTSVLPGHQLVFVGGLHRSGTTPLTDALAAHPDVSGLTGTGVSENEGIHLQDVYPRIRRYGGMGRFANDDRAHLTETSPLATAENAERMLRSWTPYWDLARPYLVEKTPSNLIMGRFLQALFPGSRLVVIVRHPVVVALAGAKWNPKVVSRTGRLHATLSGMVGHWVRAHQLLREDAAHLEHLHVLRYEDLIADPAARLADVQRFLGLSTPIPGDTLHAGRSDRYAEQWRALASGSLLQRRQRRLIESRYGEAIQGFGYSLDDLAHRDPWR
jgi:Sulfotransferase family